MNKITFCDVLVLGTIVISLHILTTLVHCQTTGSECRIHGIFSDVTIYAGMKAGLYIPYDGAINLAQMTVTKCTVHCCKKPDLIDIVFLLNKYCYCVTCYSAKLCRPVSVVPPNGFHPIAVILNKDILKFVSPTSSGKSSRISGTVFTKNPSPTDPFLTAHHVWHATTRLGRDRETPKQITSNKSTILTTLVPTTLRTALGPTRIVIKEITVEGKGNEDISIQCRGTVQISRVLAFGIVGDNKTVTDFENYCQANIKNVDNTKICHVSLKRVYKSNYPPFINTKVTYTCNYVTRDKDDVT